jgi:FkbM family methyltransferase
MKQKNTFRSNALIGFYRFWHGRLHLKGSGFLLGLCGPYFRELEYYSLDIPDVGPLTVNLRDASGMAWLNYSLGESGHEAGMIAAFKNLAPKNPVIWDVGANAGFFIAALANNLDEYAEIRMFEPNPKLMPVLRELAAHLPKTHAHNLAFSDVPGNLVLHIPAGDSTTASLTPKPGSTPVSVECTAGDLFLQSSGAADPDVVVIDTEGNDHRVIMGLKGLIKRKRPLIFFENLFLSEAVIKAALPDRYRYFTVDDLSGGLIPGLDSRRGHNSVFVPQ